MTPVPLAERVAKLETSMENLKEDVNNLPTRPELDAFKTALESMSKAQTDIMETQKDIIRFMDKWKFAGVVLLGIGAFLAQIMDWITVIWSKH